MLQRTRGQHLVLHFSGEGAAGEHVGDGLVSLITERAEALVGQAVPLETISRPAVACRC